MRTPKSASSRLADGTTQLIKKISHFYLPSTKNKSKTHQIQTATNPLFPTYVKVSEKVVQLSLNNHCHAILKKISLLSLCWLWFITHWYFFHLLFLLLLFCSPIYKYQTTKTKNISYTCTSKWCLRISNVWHGKWHKKGRGKKCVKFIEMHPMCRTFTYYMLSSWTIFGNISCMYRKIRNTTLKGFKLLSCYIPTHIFLGYTCIWICLKGCLRNKEEGKKTN